MDVDAALVDGQRLAIGRGGRDLGWGIQPQQLPASLVALENDVEEAGIAVLMAHGPLGLLRAGLAIHGGDLAWLLGTLVSCPCFLLDLGNSLQLQLPGSVEVPDRRLLPSLHGLFDVFADRRLADIQFPSDGGLAISFEIEIGDLLAALHHQHFTGGLNAHGGPP